MALAAMFASGLCLLHCLFLPALLVMMPALAVWTTLPESFHFWMLIIAVPISLMALYIGLRRHRNWMPIMIAMPGLGSGALKSTPPLPSIQNPPNPSRRTRSARERG